MKKSFRFTVSLAGVGLLALLASCREVSVTAADVASVEVLPGSANLTVGETTVLSVRVEDVSGRELRRQVSWTTSNSAVATVSSEGQVTARGPGSAMIRAAADGKSGEASVNVTTKQVTTVEIDPPVSSLVIGDSVKLDAIAKAGDGSLVTGRPATWTSSDNSVASVLPDGQVRALAVGAATITATIDGIRGQASVTVRASLQSVAAVRVEPATANVAAGDTIRFQAIATTSNGTVIPATPVWTSGSPSVATVDGTGRARGLTQGSANIVATVDGVSGQAALTVGPATIASVIVTPGSSTLALGNTIQLSAVVRATDGSVVPNVAITWSTSSSAIASVTPGGLVSAHSLGTVTITAAGGGRSGTATIFVVAQPISAIAITPANPTLLAGDTLVVSAVLTDANGVTLTGRQVTWGVTDSSVASITSTGPTTQQARLIGLAAGSIVIRALAEARSGETNATILPRAELVVSKTASASLVKAGDPIDFTLQVRNTGPSTAASVVVTDTLPSNATFVSATGGATLSNGVLTWPAIQGLASGATVSYTIRTVAGTGAVTNVGAATTTTAERNKANNRAVITVGVSPADLVVTKTAPAATITAGETIVYTVSVSNIGTSAAGSVVVTDTLPSNAQFIDATGGPAQAGNVLTWPTIGSLGAGASVNFTVRVTAPASGSVVNVAAAVSPAGDANPSDNRASVTVGVNALADVVVTKTASAATVNAGETVSYTILVQNIGPSAAAGVVVRDTLPSIGTLVPGSAGTATQAGNVLTWPTVATLASGASVSFNLSMVAPAQGTMTNVAHATTTTAEAGTANNRATAATAVRAADLTIAKSGPATTAPGSDVTYTLLAVNGGPGRATSVVVTDTLPAGLAFKSANAGGTLNGNVVAWPTIQGLDSGASVSYSVTATAAAGTHVNVAAITASSADPNTANNRTSATTIAAQADLSVSKTGPASVNAGSTVSYAMTVTNNGPSPSAGVVLQDTLPAGVTFVSASNNGTFSNGVVTWSLGTLNSGQSAQLSADVTAPAGGPPLQNVARVSASTTDPNAANNRSTATTSVIAVANLAITKAGNPAQLNPGGTIVYTIEVKNNGPSNAAGVAVSDKLPAGVTFVSAPGGTESGGTVTWPAQSLLNGATASFTVTVTAPGAAATLVNEASVTATTSDPDATDNVATATTIVTQANLAVSKTGPTAATVASPLNYTITVSNSGPNAATGVVVHDTLPSNAVFVSSSPAVTPSGNVLTWNVPSIASGANAVFTVQLTPPPGGGSVTNAADASSSTSDPDASNNHSSITTTVSPAANLSLALGASSSAPWAGDIVTYTIDITNGGPSAATNVVVSDQLPSNGSFVDATGGATPVANVITFPAIASLPSGGTASYTVRWTAPASGTLSNSASVTSPVTDPVPANNSQTVIATIAAADIEVAMSGPTAVGAGASITYTITLSNNGPGRAMGVTLSNTLPTNATLVSLDPAPTGGTAAVPQWSESMLAPGDSRTYVVEVTAPLLGNVVNSASALTSTTDGNTTNNAASVTTAINPLAADLSVKVGASHTTAAVNDTIDYTVEVTNAGPGAALVVTIGDALPANVTYVPGSATSGVVVNGSVLSWTALQIGAGVTRVYSFRAVAVSAGTATNTAGATSAVSPDPNTADNVAIVATTVT